MDNEQIRKLIKEEVELTYKQNQRLEKLGKIADYLRYCSINSPKPHSTPETSGWSININNNTPEKGLGIYWTFPTKDDAVKVVELLVNSGFIIPSVHWNQIDDGNVTITLHYQAVLP